MSGFVSPKQNTMNCTIQTCPKGQKGPKGPTEPMNELDQMTFLVSGRCRTCFFSYLESMRLSRDPEEIALSAKTNKRYLDLLLPYLDQQRKDASDSNRRQAQATISDQTRASPTAQQIRRRLEFV